VAGPDDTPTPAVEARHLTKDYGDLLAVAPLDLTIAEEERVVLVGPNGSGKTTLLRMVAGLLEPSDGEVLVYGEPAGSLEARASTSYLPDNPVLYDDLSLAEHLEYVSRLHEAEDWKERGGGLLERLGLAHRSDDLPARFSRGLRQKASIALGLVRPFSLLLVDEPFVGLDAPGKAALLDLLEAAGSAGATVVVATHQLEYVERSERCIALRDGEVTYDGPARSADVERLVS
jgi:ABC-type multidrug transport system ATPase subunit